MSQIKGWFIWSNEHDGFWCANRCGYSQFKYDAGMYSYDEALEIVTEANRHCGQRPNEAMLPAY